MIFSVVALDQGNYQSISTPHSVFSVAEAAASACAPRSISLSHNGDVAILQYDAHHQARTVRVWRAHADHASSVLLPDPNTLQRGMTAFSQVDLAGSGLYPSAHFETIDITNTGSLVATIGAYFSGAYSGVVEAPFTWSGTTWAPRVFTNALDAQNIVVGAVESAERFAANGNFANVPIDLGLADIDPDRWRLRAELVNGARASSLGSGTATAMRGRDVAGFDAKLSQPLPANPPYSEAVFWKAGRRHILGAGIACGVNSSSKVVGTNARRLGERGYPSVWVGSKRTAISRVPGTAFAISDTGIVVGSIKDRGFIFKFGGLEHHVYDLSSLVDSHGWHIKAAYAIDDRSEILALAERKGKVSLVLLVPK